MSINVNGNGQVSSNTLSSANTLANGVNEQDAQTFSRAMQPDGKLGSGNGGLQAKADMPEEDMAELLAKAKKNLVSTVARQMQQGAREMDREWNTW